MAAIGAIQNGLWSSSTTWPGGVFPTAVDDVFANTRNVYIDQNINVLSLNTTPSGAGGAAGGNFYNTGSVNITAGTIFPGTTNVLTLTGNNNVNIRSNGVIGGVTSNTYAVVIPGSLIPPPNVTITGLISGGSGPTSVCGAVRQEAGTLTVSGTFIGGSGTGGTNPGIYIISVGDFPVTFTGYGTAIGGTLNTNHNAIAVVYTGYENANKNSSISFYGTVSGSPLRTTVNGNTPAAIRLATSIPVFIYGDVIGGSGGAAAGINIGQSAIVLEGSSTVTVSGNVYSGITGLSGTPNYGALYTFGVNNTINIIGDVICRDTLNPSVALECRSGTNYVNITGNLIASSGNFNTFPPLVVGSGAGTYTIYGNVSAGRGRGIEMTVNNKVNIYGDVYGGNTPIGGAGAQGILIGSNSRGQLNVYGTVTAGVSTLCHGIGFGAYVTNFNVFAKRLRGNAYGVGTNPAAIAQVYAVGPAQNVPLLAGVNVICEELEFGPFGAPPIAMGVSFLDKTTNTITMPITSTSTATKTLVDPNFNNIMPPASSVRAGVVYSGGNLVGTCNVPTVEEVEFGVPVDNTVGIAALRPSNIWNTSSTTLTSLSTTIGYKLNNAATSETVGQLVAAFGA